MAIAQLYTGNGVTISTTEISLVSGTSSLQSDTTDGIFQVFVEVNNMAANDEFTITIKEKVYAAATQRVVMQSALVGQQAAPVWVSPSMIFLHGWDVTMIRVAGADRTFSWSIRQVA